MNNEAQSHEEIAKKMAIVLRDIINGAAHPDIAVRRVLVDLKPIRKVLDEYDELVKLQKSNDQNSSLGGGTGAMA